MSFRDNLLHLRAANNMTQEQLAVLLGVSRQSVTKWESEKSYPEMDKLLKLCQIFDCTLDDLVQGDLTGAEPRTAAACTPTGRPADVFGYDEHMSRFAEKISWGSVAPLVGVAIGIIFFALTPDGPGTFDVLPENIAAALGLLCIFCGIAVCLMSVIPAGLDHAAFVRAHPYLEDFYTEEQRLRMRHLFTSELIGGIIALFVGICVIIMLGDTSYEAIIGMPVMLLLTAVGVRFIVHGSMTLAKANIANYNEAAGEVLSAQEIAQASVPVDQKREMLEVHHQDKRISAVCGTIMIIATIAGLVMLFVPEYYSSLFWLAWPIGGLLCGIAALLFKGVSNPRA